jgi:GxxExxY protein
MKPFLHKELTNRIIGIYYEVYTDLGFGFSEKVYQNAMFYELQRQGYEVEAQKPIKVFHKGVIVGEYFADILVENQVLLELKAADKLALEHEYQLIN